MGVAGGWRGRGSGRARTFSTGLGARVAGTATRRKTVGRWGGLDPLNELLSPPSAVGRMLSACWKEDRRASCCRIVACADPIPRSPITRRLCRGQQRLPPQRRQPRTRGSSIAIIASTITTITTTNTTTTIITITNASRPPLLLPRLLPSRARITLRYRRRRRRPRRRPLFTTFNHGLERANEQRAGSMYNSRDARDLCTRVRSCSIGRPIDFVVLFPPRVSFVSFRVEWGTMIVGRI